MTWTINCTLKFTQLMDRQGRYDHVILATHADTTMRLLGGQITEVEKEVLSCFEYASNEIVIHTDASLMPKSKAAWSSWNVIASSTAANTKDEEAVNTPICLTY